MNDRSGADSIGHGSMYGEERCAPLPLLQMVGHRGHLE